MVGKVIQWLDDRVGIHAIDAALVSRHVPKLNLFYTLGFASLFTFILMAVSGMFLAAYYAPTTDHAYNSLKYVTETVTFGWLVRGIHHYGASTMVIVVVLHMLRTFYFGAYKYPRELTWVTGVALLGVTLGLGFTGYLLPWDQKAYWATVVGTKVPESIPVVGELSKVVLRGGLDMGALTLTRFYAIHMLMLPALMLVFMGIHLYLVIKIGITALPSKLDEAYDRVKGA
jgi:quinol-cytochrome oxidoreductase complex cytochrome b subunit